MLSSRISLHGITAIDTERKVVQLESGTFSKRIVVKGESNEDVEIVFFSKDADVLIGEKHDNFMMKTTIEDVAFNMWNGENDARVFVTSFFMQYSEFEKYWNATELAKRLNERL